MGKVCAEDGKHSGQVGWNSITRILLSIRLEYEEKGGRLYGPQLLSQRARCIAGHPWRMDGEWLARSAVDP